MSRRFFVLFFIFIVIMTGCSSPITQDDPHIRVMAVESFLADIAQNVAGELFQVESLIPYGIDPHSFELTPKDIARIAESQVLLINGGGLETWLDAILSQQDFDLELINCSDGLQFRKSATTEDEIGHTHENDPHFWMNPLNVTQYVKNISQAFSAIDPLHKTAYEENADSYISKLVELDIWIENELAQIPQQNRKLITNHENLGYFADRYGFEIIGSILTSTSSSSMPSATSLTELEHLIVSSKVKAIFMNLGENTQLADQIGSDMGILVVTGLYTHSLSDVDGPAPDYISMMKYDVSLICNALRENEE